MKLAILMVTLRELSQSFPEYIVFKMNNREIGLEDTSFNRITVFLDEEGRIINREELLIFRKSILNN